MADATVPWITLRDTDIIQTHDGFGLFNSLTMDGDYWVLDLNAANQTSGSYFARGLTIVCQNRLADWGYAASIDAGDPLGFPLFMYAIDRDVGWTTATIAAVGLFNYSAYAIPSEPGFFGGGYNGSTSIITFYQSFTAYGISGGGMPAAYTAPCFGLIAGVPGITRTGITGAWNQIGHVGTWAVSDTSNNWVQSGATNNNILPAAPQIDGFAKNSLLAIHIAYTANIAAPQQIRFRARVGAADPRLLWAGVM